tara:strand:+ start:579 stop:878 length:300 start_codon:yes stop_codon:yes gene_type:complete
MPYIGNVNAYESVGTSDLEDNAVTTAKVVDGAITAAKINSAVALGGPSLGLNSIIRTNAQVINEDITIPSSTNASTIGDITVNAGKTVTVSSGSTWVII